MTGKPGEIGPPGLTGPPGPTGYPGEAGIPGHTIAKIPLNTATVPSCEAEWKMISNPNWLDFIISDENYQQKILQSSKKIVLIKRNVNFNAAVRVCQTIGGNVVLPVSKAENKEIVDFIIEKIGDRAAWLRISDEHQEGVWRDTFDQRELKGFTHWAASEPNNQRGYEHNAVVHVTHWKNTNGAGSWNDVRGSNNFFILCEFE